jgi:maltooligosyltrehalose trehalohydrolase
MAVSRPTGGPAVLAGPPAPGARPLTEDCTEFVVWAPSASRVRLHLADAAQRPVELAPIGRGYHRGEIEGRSVGTRYRFSLDGAVELADPASRSQPEGITGPSEVVDLTAHDWSDAHYRARPLADWVISECHVGALTSEGTFDAARMVLDEMAEVGINAIELMPVAQFSGSRNWGYDGVFPYAVQHSYGGPLGLQRLVDACHERGLAVVLDVVYNHLGPEGNALSFFGPYFTERYRTPWGPAMNVDGPGSDEVRRYVLWNARQWFVDFHVDALRLDAIHGIVDPTATPLVAELADLSRALAVELGRPCPLIAESADNNPAVVTPRNAGGLGMDAQWNDDFHHALHAAVTGERRGYYVDFGRVEDLARAMSDGFVYQGQYSTHRGRRHGAPSGSIPPERFVVFAQNHDHIGNRPAGARLASLVDPAQLRLTAAAVCLSPGIPLLFMGDEYGATEPFPFFVDYADGALVDQVRRGRSEELAALGFSSEPLDPVAAATFALAVLHRDRPLEEVQLGLRALYRRLLELRAGHPALGATPRGDVTVDVAGSVLRLLRWHPIGSIAVLFHLGADDGGAHLPTLGTPGAPGGSTWWHKVLDSADSAWGGSGVPAPDGGPPGGPVALGPWGFCAYSTGPDGMDLVRR